MGAGAGQPSAPARKPVMLVVVVLGVLAVAGGWYFLRPTPPANSPAHAPAASNTTEAVAETPPAPGVPRPATPAAAVATPLMPPSAPAPSTQATAAPPATAAQAAPRTEPSGYTRTLVGNLAGLDLSKGALTPEQVQFWKEEYDKLVKEGAAAVPAIRELLEKNADQNFASVSGGTDLGAPSLRLAMIEALRQIGGPEALAVAAQTMQTAANPREIAILARNLESAAPGQYGDAAVAAARMGLMQAGVNTAAVDTAPLFEVMQKFGGASTAFELEQTANKWNYYAPLALASLPEGAGVASLTRMAQNADGAFGGSSRFACQMLGELAARYPDAAKALAEQVAANKVPDSAWVGLASALGGVQTFYGDGYLNASQPPAGATEPKSYHIPSNQQTYRSFNVSPGWTPEQVQRQLTLIDQLRAANPTANQMLEGVRNALAARQGQ